MDEFRNLHGRVEAAVARIQNVEAQRRQSDVRLAHLVDLFESSLRQQRDELELLKNENAQLVELVQRMLATVEATKIEGVEAAFGQFDQRMTELIAALEGTGNTGITGENDAEAAVTAAAADDKADGEKLVAVLNEMHQATRDIDAPPGNSADARRA